MFCVSYFFLFLFLFRLNAVCAPSSNLRAQRLATDIVVPVEKDDVFGSSFASMKSPQNVSSNEQVNPPRFLLFRWERFCTRARDLRPFSVVGQKVPHVLDATEKNVFGRRAGVRDRSSPSKTARNLTSKSSESGGFSFPAFFENFKRYMAGIFGKVISIAKSAKSRNVESKRISNNSASFLLFTESPQLEASSVPTGASSEKASVTEDNGSSNPRVSMRQRRAVQHNIQEHGNVVLVEENVKVVGPVDATASPTLFTPPRAEKETTSEATLSSGATDTPKTTMSAAIDQATNNDIRNAEIPTLADSSAVVVADTALETNAPGKHDTLPVRISDEEAPEGDAAVEQQNVFKPEAREDSLVQRAEQEANAQPSVDIALEDFVEKPASSETVGGNAGDNRKDEAVSSLTTMGFDAAQEQEPQVNAVPVEVEEQEQLSSRATLLEPTNLTSAESATKVSVNEEDAREPITVVEKTTEVQKRPIARHEILAGVEPTVELESIEAVKNHSTMPDTDVETSEETEAFERQQETETLDSEEKSKTPDALGKQTPEDVKNGSVGFKETMSSEAPAEPESQVAGTPVGLAEHRLPNHQALQNQEGAFVNETSLGVPDSVISNQSSETSSDKESDLESVSRVENGAGTRDQLATKLDADVDFLKKTEMDKSLGEFSSAPKVDIVEAEKLKTRIQEEQEILNRATKNETSEIENKDVPAASHLLKETVAVETNVHAAQDLGNGGTSTDAELRNTAKPTTSNGVPEESGSVLMQGPETATESVVATSSSKDTTLEGKDVPDTPEVSTPAPETGGNVSREPSVNSETVLEEMPTQEASERQASEKQASEVKSSGVDNVLRTLKDASQHHVESTLSTQVPVETTSTVLTVLQEELHTTVPPVTASLNEMVSTENVKQPDETQLMLPDDKERPELQQTDKDAVVESEKMTNKAVSLTLPPSSLLSSSVEEYDIPDVIRSSINEANERVNCKFDSFYLTVAIMWTLRRLQVAYSCTATGWIWRTEDCQEGVGSILSRRF